MGEKGVTVNVISIIGAECNLQTLSKLADATDGNVERYDPADLMKNVVTMVSKPLIASNVQLKVKLHKGLKFRREDKESLKQNNTLLVRDIGNVTEDSQITFEYSLKPINEIINMEDIDLETIKSFPFQAQITYTSLDGSKGMRVLTQEQSISSDREELEKKADYGLMAQNCIQVSAKMAKDGNYRQAQVHAKVMNRKMRMNAKNDEVKGFKSEFIDNFDSLYK